MAKSLIKNIIFDLGGVILDLDRQRLFAEFAKFSRVPLAEIFNQRHQVKLFDLFEVGKISAEEFRAGLLEQLKIKTLSASEFDNAWNSMLLTVPVKRLQCLQNLKKQYKTILLSNTNSIHVKQINKILDQTIGQQAFKQCFDKIYFSCDIGMRKPNQDVLEHILLENNLNPVETLFVDDTLINVESASGINLKVMHITETNTLLDIDNHIMALSNN